MLENEEFIIVVPEPEFMHAAGLPPKLRLMFIKDELMIFDPIKSIPVVVTIFYIVVFII